MADIVNLLIIDDHQAVIEGYKSILSYAAFEQYDINIETAFNCESAFKIITNKALHFDIVFLDMILPPFIEQQLYSGEDLAALIKVRLPKAKIILLTSHSESIILFNLIQHLSPDGLLVKSDFSADEFILAFNTVLQGGLYHSSTAMKSLKEFQQKDFTLDAYNRRIISLLSKGISTKNLPSHIKLTISAIDKRKAQIKTFFDIQKGGDEDIIREARKRGFI